VELLSKENEIELIREELIEAYPETWAKI